MRKSTTSCASLVNSNTLVVKYINDDHVDEEIRINDITINKKEQIEFSEEIFDKK